MDNVPCIFVDLFLTRIAFGFINKYLIIINIKKSQLVERILVSGMYVHTQVGMYY